MSKLNRKDLKHPDALQHQITAFIKTVSKHLKNIMLVVYIVIGVLLITFSYKYFSARQVRKDTSLYYHTIKSIKPENTKLIEKKFKAILPKLKTKEIKCYVSYKLADFLYRDKKYKEAIVLYKDIKDNGKDLLKELARFGLAKSYEMTADTKKAIKLYKIIIKNKFHVYRPLSMLALANIYTKQNKKQLALATLENIIISYKNTEYSKMAFLYKKELN